MVIEQARLEDLPQILARYAQAREFMVSTGNPNQWASRAWPPEALIRQDISRGKCYVCRDEGGIAAVFYYDRGEDIDPTYRTMVSGAWGSDGVYAVVHRIAARPGSGAGKRCIRWAYDRGGPLRIDTHQDNAVMRHILTSLGFTLRGVIITDDGTPRLAFEKL